MCAFQNHGKVALFWKGFPIDVGLWLCGLVFSNKSIIDIKCKYGTRSPFQFILKALSGFEVRVNHVCMKLTLYIVMAGLTGSILLVLVRGNCKAPAY